MNYMGDHSVADLVIGHIRTHRGDNTGGILAGREGRRRIVLVLSVNRQQIGEIDTAGLYVDQNLIATRCGIGNVGNGYASVRCIRDNDGTHVCLSFFSIVTCF